MRRYQQMQLNHILDELHLIAEGRYDRRIPFQLSGDMGQVVNSINRLVDSTVNALEEERAIEKSKDELIDMLHKVLEQEQKSKLQPFPFVENDGYLLLLKNGLCITARWSYGHFNDDTTETCIEEEIESFVALKELGL